jgi:hypothetical protein
MLEHDPKRAKASGMSHEQLRDFAATPRKGLPEHVPHNGDGCAGTEHMAYGRMAAAPRIPLYKAPPMKPTNDFTPAPGPNNPRPPFYKAAALTR